MSKHLTYPYLLGHHYLYGPWTRFEFLAYSLYVTVNVFCLCFPSWSASEVGQRARTLSLVNLIFLFAGAHLSFVADILGVSLRTYRALHRAAGWMTAVLSAVHAALMANQKSFSLPDTVDPEISLTVEHSFVVSRTLILVQI
jgi:ferric-chelate reductase